MDSIILSLDFQQNRLGYRFQNVDLLMEAVTHSLVSRTTNPHFPEKNKTYDRLGMVGESVLKLVVSQYVLMAAKIGTDESITWLKSQLLEVAKQNEIGKKLFLAKDNIINLPTNGKNDIPEFIRVDPANWRNPGFVFPYHKVVKGLFGAVFIDAGGSTGISLETCHKLFLRLWRPYLKDKGTLKSIQTCFPTPKREVSQFWLKNGINLPFIRRMEERLGIQLKRGDILCEAVIQKSFYDPIRNDPIVGKMHQPDYERLEYLGDSVLGLIITEHVWNHNPDMNVGDMVVMITSLITDEFQSRIYKRLRLGEFVKMKRGRIQGWEKHGDIVESIVGAIYVDGGILRAIHFVFKAWGLPLKLSFHGPSFKDLQSKLDYSFKNQKILLEAFNLERTDSKENLEEIGNSILHFFYIDYSLRTGKTKAGEIALAKTGKSVPIIDPNIILGLTSYLELRYQVESLNGCENLPKDKLRIFVGKIFGAIWKDLRDSNNNVPWLKLRYIFYRIFNPYLLNCPSKTLILEDLTKVVLSTHQKQEFKQVQNNIPHKFKHDYLLAHLLERMDDENSDLEDKLEFIGCHVAHLISVLHICGCLKLKNVKHQGEFKEEVLKACFLSLKEKLNLKIIMKQFSESGINKQLRKDKNLVDKEEDCWMHILLGAIYVDTQDNSLSYGGEYSGDDNGMGINRLFTLLNGNDKSEFTFPSN